MDILRTFAYYVHFAHFAQIHKKEERGRILWLNIRTQTYMTVHSFR